MKNRPTIRSQVYGLLLFLLILLIVLPCTYCAKRKRATPIVTHDTTVIVKIKEVPMVDLGFEIPSLIDPAGIQNVVVAISNVEEKEKVKKNIYQYLEKHTPQDIVLKSNDLGLQLKKDNIGNIKVMAHREARIENDSSIRIRKTTIPPDNEKEKRPWIPRLLYFAIIVFVLLYFFLRK